MLNYVHQLVTYFVCLLFGAEQVVCSRFLELCHWKQLRLKKQCYDSDEIKVVDQTVKTIIWNLL